MVAQGSSTSEAGLEDLPELRRYLTSLPVAERSAATDTVTSLAAADLLSLGVSEPQHAEHNYRVEQVDGVIPDQLRGTLYRNGPGRWEDHTGRPLRHLFDGDGMLSAFRIDDDGVHFRNRYVHTRHFLGKGGTRHLGTAAAGGVSRNIARPPPNLANTNVVAHAGHLYALWEGGPPHEIDPTPWRPSEYAGSAGSCDGWVRTRRTRAGARAPAPCSTSASSSSRGRICASTAPTGAAPYGISARHPCRMPPWCTTSR